MLQGLGHGRLPSRSFHYLLDDVLRWRALLICRIRLPVVVKDSISEHSPLHFVLTLLMDVMLDVAR